MTEHRDPGTIQDLRSSSSAVVTLAAAAGLLFAFRSVLWPFALAFVLAVLITTLTRRIERRLSKAPKWIIFTLTAMLVGVVVAGVMLVMSAGATRILAAAPALGTRLQEVLASTNLPGMSATRLSELMVQIDIRPLAAMLFGSIQDAGAGLGLTILFLIFLTFSRTRIERKVQLIVASGRTHRTVTVLRRSIAGIEAYVLIQTITGLMIAVGSGLVMLAVGLDNAVFWALFLLLLSYIPMVGVLLGSVGPALFAMLQFPTLMPALIIFGGIQLIANIVGNLILPRMQADSQNIDPTTSLLAIGIWTVLWGIPGSLLAIPLTLTLMYALAQYPNLRWIAVLMSNDGSPLPPVADESEHDDVPASGSKPSSAPSQ